MVMNIYILPSHAHLSFRGYIVTQALPACIVYCVSNLFIFVNLGVLIVSNIVNTILLNMSYWTKRRKINASVAMQVASLTRECYLPSLRTVNSS